jgi:Ca2+:H+ antiporter
MTEPSSQNSARSAVLSREWALAVAAATAALFFFGGPLGSGALGLGLVVVGLFAVVLLAAFAVVRHAEALAHLLGEPLGTLVLTLAVICIEVAVISATMAAGDGSPTLARDTMYAVVMLALNGLVGASLVLGGLRYREQTFNLQGASAYLAVLVPIAVLTLVLPNFTTATPDATYSPLQSGLFALSALGLYGVFLAIQNVRHRAYFLPPEGESADPASAGTTADAAGHHAGEARSAGHHGALLVAYLGLIVYLAKQLSKPLDAGVGAVGAPEALVGLLVAALVFSPEAVTAVRAALANELQRSVNLLLGSALASISLTVPAVLVIGLVTGQSVVLGLRPADMVLLTLTLLVSTLTFASARTNVLLGAVHLVLFVSYLALLFDAGA